ncbi:MAG: hypothetical protein OXC31_24090 [Spirochaetaceae bacterium]|nr:hypothetical protein [Spirochaetaceae bacterium]
MSEGRGAGLARCSRQIPVADHDVPDVQRRIDAPRNAGEHDPFDVEAVQGELCRHRRVDDADPAQEEHDTLTLQSPDGELDAVYGVRRRFGEIALEYRELRRKG